jgi:hypothetical protein
VIELRGTKVTLRTLERADCRQLWDNYEPTEPLNPGLSSEGADRWFEEMQARQGREQLYLGIFDFEGRLLEACGFRREGARRQSVFRCGRRWDEITYGLLAAEFADGGSGDDHRR